MAKVLDAFPGGVPDTRSCYSWAKWFDGQPWELKRGTDFNVRVKSFQSMALAKAYRERLTLHTVVVDENTVVIQVSNRSQPCE